MLLLLLAAGCELHCAYFSNGKCALSNWMDEEDGTAERIVTERRFIYIHTDRIKEEERKRRGVSRKEEIRKRNDLRPNSPA